MLLDRLSSYIIIRGPGYIGLFEAPAIDVFAP
jgi:hypothetical protein